MHFRDDYIMLRFTLLFSCSRTRMNAGAGFSNSKIFSILILRSNLLYKQIGFKMCIMEQHGSKRKHIFCFWSNLYGLVCEVFGFKRTILGSLY